jgi:hypothetical protein
MQVRRILYWLTPATAPLVEAFRPDGPIGGVAASLGAASRMPAALARVLAQGLDLFLDPELWLVQLHPDHPWRRRIRGSALEWTRGRFDPRVTALSDAYCEEIVERCLSESIRAGATILTPPVHWYPEGDLNSLGRANDLKLAKFFASVAQAAVVRQPAGGGPRRVVLTSIALELARLKPTQVRFLVDAYADAAIPCDGYLIWPWNFTGSPSQFRTLRRLARMLEAKTGRPVLVAGVGQLWLGALANGLAGLCHGWGRNQLQRPPVHEEPPFDQDRDREDDTGQERAVPLYFRDILGTVAVPAAWEAARLALIRRRACGCGTHDQLTPPATQIAAHSHNIFELEELALEVMAGVPRTSTGLLIPRFQAAAADRSVLGLSPLASGWPAALDLAGWGLSDPRIGRDGPAWRAAVD